MNRVEKSDDDHDGHEGCGECKNGFLGVGLRGYVDPCGIKAPKSGGKG